MLLIPCCQIEEFPFNLKGKCDPKKSGGACVLEKELI